MFFETFLFPFFSFGFGERFDDSDSPETSLNRQDIAMGVSPIAARESVVKYQMALKEDQFVEVKHFKIYAATWNVNGQSPTGPLNEWLAPDPDPPG